MKKELPSITHFKQEQLHGARVAPGRTARILEFSRRARSALILDDSASSIRASLRAQTKDYPCPRCGRTIAGGCICWDDARITGRKEVVRGA